MNVQNRLFLEVREAEVPGWGLKGAARRRPEPPGARACPSPGAQARSAPAHAHPSQATESPGQSTGPRKGFWASWARVTASWGRMTPVIRVL